MVTSHSKPGDSYGNQMCSPVTLSVCMIAYNHGQFIAQAIESILSQDVDFDIELVIGDDCSKDDTYGICQSYARRDRRVKLLNRDHNLGVMPNFSRTLQACTGEYIAICEGDDYWTDPCKLREQVSFLRSHVEFAGSAHQSSVLVNEQAVRKFRLGVPETIVTEDLLAGRLFHTASLMFRRQAVGLFCQSPQVLSCDRLLNLCVSFMGPIHYSEANMCVYRLHAGGMSSNATVEQMKLDLRCIDYLQSLQPRFPKYRYLSYVYATVGLCRSATAFQRCWFVFLSVLLSFSYFPSNVRIYTAHWFRTVRRKPETTAIRPS